MTKPLVPVEISPALMLWPAPSKAKSMSNFGSFCLPSVWKGPLTVSETGPLTPWVFLASIFSERLSLPDSTFLFLPLNVLARRVSTSVSELASLPPPSLLPQAAKTSAETISRHSKIGRKMRFIRRRA